ncbi:DUF2188 domain-containing protein [Cupriavidus basilensis]
MTYKANVHVIPHGNGWDVRQDGAAGARFHYDTMEDVIKAGTALAEREKVELMVHGMNAKYALVAT